MYSAHCSILGETVLRRIKMQMFTDGVEDAETTRPSTSETSGESAGSRSDYLERQIVRMDEQCHVRRSVTIDLARIDITNTMSTRHIEEGGCDVERSWR